MDDPEGDGDVGEEEIGIDIVDIIIDGVEKAREEEENAEYCRPPPPQKKDRTCDCGENDGGVAELRHHALKEIPELAPGALGGRKDPHPVLLPGEVPQESLKINRIPPVHQRRLGGADRKVEVKRKSRKKRE